MPLRSAVLALTVFALAAIAVPAQAATVSGHNVDTPGHAISCFAVMPSAGGGIECQSDYLPDTGELDPYVALHRHGHAHLGQRGDYPGYDGAARRLRDGDVWTRRGIRCRYADRKLTCRNAARHGFVLSAAGARRF